jgi:uncharacterized protein (TIGR00290 family)
MLQDNQQHALVCRPDRKRLSVRPLRSSLPVLWTGGKDSALALYEARRAGYFIDRLVTFAPFNPDFLAHPIALMRAQAHAMGLLHEVLEIGPDARAGYRSAIARLRQQDGIAVLITGDIDLVEGMPNFVHECSRGLDVDVFMPLWQRNRSELMRKLVDLDFEVIFTLVKQPWFTIDWLGRRIGVECLHALEELHRATGIDICWENGEYHTMVLNGPMFDERLSLELGASKLVDQMAYLSVKMINPERVPQEGVQHYG